MKLLTPIRVFGIFLILSNIWTSASSQPYETSDLATGRCPWNPSDTLGHIECLKHEIAVLDSMLNAKDRADNSGHEENRRYAEWRAIQQAVSERKAEEINGNLGELISLAFLSETLRIKILSSNSGTHKPEDLPEDVRQKLNALFETPAKKEK